MTRRGLLIALAVGLGASADAGPSSSLSNPAFLGIALQDLTPQGPCMVYGVTKDSAAEIAGLRQNDQLLSLDGVPTPDCTTLRGAIVAHAAGERVKIDVLRPGSPRFVADVVLLSRAEILRQRFVGEVIDLPDLVDFDHEDGDDRELGMPELRGRTTIVGWFLLDRCAGCSKAFDRLLDALARQRGDQQPLVIAATAPQMRDLKGYRSNLTAHVPLYVTDDAEALEKFALMDAERVSFMVIDGRGVVRFVMPIAAEADDDDGAIDELLAAVEQAEHARRR